mmetsp:Transcript_24278/g.57879  ORF Transcript_24278/g.57879 Transcript_24278/m.57879 type:complete len:329 (-) Transcript_24278:118-1104(-)
MLYTAPARSSPEPNSTFSGASPDAIFAYIWKHVSPMPFATLRCPSGSADEDAPSTNMPPTKQARWSILWIGCPPLLSATYMCPAEEVLTSSFMMPAAASSYIFLSQASLPPRCTHTLRRYSKAESPIAPSDTCPVVKRPWFTSMYSGISPLGRGCASMCLKTFIAMLSYLGSLVCRDSDPNSSWTVATSARIAAPPVHPGVLPCPLCKLMVAYGNPVAVPNALDSRSPMSLALSRRPWSHPSGRSHVVSYAESNPPRTRMVVSKKETSPLCSKCSSLLTHSAAFLNSVISPMMASVLIASMMVPPCPSQLCPVFAWGMSSSVPHAKFL